MIVKICKNCQQIFEITAEDQAFYAKINVPEPTHCPDCRLQRKMAFNNETKLYQRKCDFTGKNILSIFSPDKPYKVYSQEVWWSDKWDALEYGRDFNFNKSFFEQFNELFLAVPQYSVKNNYLLDQNSEYTNYAGSNKNCYLIFHADYNEDCYYGYGVKKCKNSIDLYNLFDSELCYECVDCHNCYNLNFSQNCINCSDSSFLKDCIGCKNCFGCKNLYQKEYHIFNKPYSREEYEKHMKNAPISSNEKINDFREKFEEFSLKLPNRFLHMFQTENCCGDNLVNCRNVTDSFDIKDLFDGKYCYQVYNGAQNCMDMYQFGLHSELIYEGSIIGYNAHNIRFCHMCNEQVSDLTYCMECYHSNNLFGCVGLRHKQYCILNKQYTRREYEELIPKIIKHMGSQFGEFFPIQISPFGYNETIAQEYFPLNKKQTISKGYKWKDCEDIHET